VLRLYFVFEMAPVELKSERVKAPAEVPHGGGAGW
jgi:hypothetical protein